MYDKVYKMNTRAGIWRYSPRLRITYVAQGWFVVWDHQHAPPTRYDCQGQNHHAACDLVMHKLRDLEVG